MVNGVTGKLKVNCRNRVRSAVYNYDGAVGSIPNTGVTTGTIIDYWDTIDDYNAGTSGLPTSVVSGWTNNDCWGVEVSTDDTPMSGKMLRRLALDWQLALDLLKTAP